MALEATPILELIRDANGDGLPDGLERIVTVVGIVTTAPRVDRESLSSLNMQDETGGIVILADRDRLVGELRPGDVVRVRGKVAQNSNGVTQLLAEDAAWVRREAAPAPRDALAADVIAKRFPGQLVRMAGQLVVPPGFRSGNNDSPLRLRDRSGEVEIAVPSSLFKDAAFAKRLEQGGSVTITGMARQSRGRLVPVTKSDFQFEPLPPYRTILSITPATPCRRGDR